MQNNNPTAGVDQDEREKLGFLYAAINDAQAAIRAVDTKLSIAIVTFSLSLAKLDSLHSTAMHAYRANCYATSIFSTAFVLCWLVGLFAAFRGLIVIDNPAAHIDAPGASGIFYSGHRFRPTAMQAFFKPSALPQIDLVKAIEDLPDSATAIKTELAFEHIKLVYIRTIKMARSRIAYYSLIAWLICGATVWGLALMTSVK